MNYLMLVKENKIKDKYLKDIILINYKNINNKIINIEKETLNNFLKLKEDLEKNNIFIDIKKINENESILGTSFELLIEDSNKEKYNIIISILSKYGFIIRYPDDNKNIIRYIGKVPATIISNNNISLEQYLDNYSGVLVVNKPKDMTSFDAVNSVKKILGINKIGHTGTLDPLAEGVLVITIGKATKIGELLTSYEKEYIATAKLGINTDTLDITGNIIDKKEIDNNLDIEKVINSYKKTYLQEVPKYSAVKVKGKKLYEYARNNEEVILPKKEVTIKEISLISKTKDTFKFKCRVSKGTYIRSLIRDIANSLNNYATMTELVRTKQGAFFINNSYTLDDIKNNNFRILSIEESLNYNVIVLDKELSSKAKNGVKIPNNYNIMDKVIFKDQDNKLIGIYQVDGNYLKVWKNFI